MSEFNWRVVGRFNGHALSIVDGLGKFASYGAHYSRRTPGSESFVGCGKSVILVTDTAVWAVIYQKTPAGNHWLWRNNVFRNLGSALSSELIKSALDKTYIEWEKKYGSIPDQRMRTEINIKKVRSTNPGYCYKCAGWERGGIVNNILFYYEPQTPERFEI